MLAASIVALVDTSFACPTEVSGVQKVLKLRCRHTQQGQQATYGPEVERHVRRSLRALCEANTIWFRLRLECETSSVVSSRFCPIIVANQFTMYNFMTLVVQHIIASCWRVGEHEIKIK